MINSQKLNDFVKSIDRNAPLNHGYSYPYKPALIIAIFTNTPLHKVFNYPININQPKILKTYYNLLTSDVYLFEQLRQQKSKCELINLGFNEQVGKLLLDNIFRMPAKKIDWCNGLWQVDKNVHTITINLEANPNEWEAYKHWILQHAYKTLKKCVPTYSLYKDEILDNFDQVVVTALHDQVVHNCNTHFNNESQYQHTFIKQVKDRDKKCVICCEQQPELLQVARFKSTHDCLNNIEKYSVDNGITLCANHKILFEKHYFTFNEDWTVKFAKSFKTSEYYLRLKQFETCYEVLQSSKYTKINDFLKYRNHTYPI